MTDVALSLLDGIAGLPLWALALVVALAVTAESSLFVGLVVPGDIIVLLAASGGASPHRIVLLILAVAAGSVAGEAIGYGIGRRWGGRVRASRLGRALGEARWDKAAGVLERHGARAVFGARYVAAVHALLPVLAGTLEMPRRRFLSWSAAGALSWATLYVGAGAAAGASFRRAAEHLTTVTLVVVGVAAVLATLAHLRTTRRARRAATATAIATATAPGVASAVGAGPTPAAPAATASTSGPDETTATTARDENVRWAPVPAGLSGGNGGQVVPGRTRDASGAGPGVRAATAPPPAFVARCGCGCDAGRSTAA